MEVRDIVEMLKIAEKTVATAESCTGGLVAKRLTDICGASEVFKYGVVTYSDEAKMKLLNVKEETLRQHTAVSKETAAEMAHGILELSGADIGVATTGYASGAHAGKIFVAVENKNGYRFVRLLDCDGGREAQRDATAVVAMEMILMGLLKEGI